MTIQLPAATDALIRQKVTSGLYASAEEAIAAAVQLLDEHDRKRQWLLAELQVAFDQEARGEMIELHPGDDGAVDARGRRAHSSGVAGARCRHAVGCGSLLPPRPIAARSCRTLAHRDW